MPCLHATAQIYGGVICGLNVYYRPSHGTCANCLQRTDIARELPPVPISPCTGCGKPDPAKPFGSPSMIAETLGE